MTGRTMELGEALGARLRAEWKPLCVVIALTAIAKCGALLPGYSLDDWGNANGPIPALVADVLHKGRIGHWLLLRVGTALQVELFPARILFVALSIVAYAVFGWVVVRFLGAPARGWLSVVSAAMVANHPYTVEIFTFRVGLPPAAIVLAILALMLLLATRPALRLGTGMVLFAVALSFYQVVLHFALMVVLVGAASGLARGMARGGPASRPDVPGRGRIAARLLADRNARLLAYVLGGGALYYATGLVIAPLVGVWGNLFVPLAPDQVPARIAEMSRQLWATAAGVNVLVPPVVQVLFALLVLGVACGLLRGAVVAERRGAAGVRALATAALLVVAWHWGAGVYLFMHDAWPVPRNMAHLGILWAGCVLIAASTLPWSVTRGAVGAFATLALLSFIGVSQHILEEQRRLNMRDLLLANRVVARLETIPGFHRARRVTFSGGRGWYPAGVQRTQWGDLNISGFAAYWSKTALLREASGYDLVAANRPEEQAAADSYCANHEPWPAAASVAVEDGLVIICFATPAP